MSEKHPVDNLLTTWEHALRRHDADGLAALVTKDCEFWSPGVPPLKGAEAVRASFSELFKKYRLEQTFEEVERIVAGEWIILRGTEHDTVRPRDGIGETMVHNRVFTICHLDADGQWRFARGMTQFLAPTV